MVGVRGIDHRVGPNAVIIKTNRKDSEALKAWIAFRNIKMVIVAYLFFETFKSSEKIPKERAWASNGRQLQQVERCHVLCILDRKFSFNLNLPESVLNHKST